jgi:hypothetical protein
MPQNVARKRVPILIVLQNEAVIDLKPSKTSDFPYQLSGTVCAKLKDQPAAGWLRYAQILFI